MVWNVPMIGKSSLWATNIWFYMRFQEAFTYITSFNSSTTLGGSEWRVHSTEEATAEGHSEKWQGQDTNLDLLPPRSEHSPTLSKFWKILLLALALFNVLVRHTRNRRRRQRWRKFPNSPHFPMIIPLSSVLILIIMDGVACLCVNYDCKTSIWP